MSISVIALLTAEAEVIESIKPVLQDLIIKSRAESGCIRYDAFIGDNGVTFVEEWASTDILNTHEKTEHFQKLVHEIGKNNMNIEISFVKPLI
ncbi:antibiotic biosynthesis monooxygenase [Citrobacter sp. JGM124]|uniref:putative quinol monooxygenase n=1 Tax=Citrobacter sp. JGM124 TaxID=2799789 RepID=UPI001BA5A3A9|nr:antibiotic biosynthesis monooxygenase [Citrobacter sp. JGM124]MBS0849012.1 antibiotic biosynthesis monooxygenase [Citrobacter sp. JGM124]